VPVLGKNDKPAKYTVRLYFAELENKKAGERIFNIKLQGETVLDGFDVWKEGEASHKAVVREFREVQVNDNLEIELIGGNREVLSMSLAPILCGVEVTRRK